MDIFISFAFLCLAVMAWLLFKAKKLTQFKREITLNIKPKLIKAIEEELNETRCDLLPNSAQHLEAAIYFWTCSQARILQAALEREIITTQWLKSTGNYRNCQHLFHIEKHMLLAEDRIQPITFKLEEKNPKI